MVVPKETVWSLEPHTKAKHEILRRYLGAWFAIVNKRYRRIIYLDGFCGPGRYKDGEPGSPVLALEVAINHRKPLEGELLFWFIDEREDRIAHLHRGLQQMKIPFHFNVTVECGRFHEKLSLVLNSIATERAIPAATFAFIDPFGFSGIPFSLIKRLLNQRSCEALITFQVDAINRFLEHPRDEVVRHIVDAFGTESVIRIAESAEDRIVKLRTLYQSQLKKVAEFVRFFEMRDRNDRLQYFLFFATNNELGHVKMKEAMWRKDPSGAFRFSDATNPNQIVLLDVNRVRILGDDLKEQFRGVRAITVDKIRKHVENKTAFLKKHMGEVLKDMENNHIISVNELKIDGKKRRAGTFPDGVKLTFS